jgi:flagellar basal-body rod modification protein FlgD
VTGLGELQQSFEGLATSLVSDQALQAASLVGRSVLVDSGEGFLQEGAAVTGAVDLPVSAGAVRVQITDVSGQVVRQIDLGPNAEGLVRFLWGGETDAGVIAPPGRYTLSAQYFDGSEMQIASTLVNAAVESVTVGAGGLSVKLQGLGEVPFGAVREIG